MRTLHSTSLAIYVLLLLITVQSLPATAGAQPRLLPQSLNLTFALPKLAPPLDNQWHVSLRRARWLMTIGSGMIAGSIVGLGLWQLRNPGCESDGSEPLYMPAIGAALFSVTGAGLLTGGVLRIGGVPIGHRNEHPIRKGKLAAVLGGTTLSAAVTTVGVLGIGAKQWVKCATH